MAARGTAIEMPAQRGGPTAHDRPQDTEVLRGEPDAMTLDEACAVTTDDGDVILGRFGTDHQHRRGHKLGRVPLCKLASDPLLPR